MFRSIGVCGPADLQPNAWFFEDYALMHASLPQMSDSRFLHCVDLESGDAKRELGLHGNSRAPRLQLSTDLSFSKRVLPRDLKKEFLECFADFALVTAPDDRLLVFINGHGHSEYGSEGGVELGLNRKGHPKLVLPQEVLGKLACCRGSVTVVVNSCHSGYWRTKFDEYQETMPGGLSEVTLVVRSGEGEEILAHSVSGSGKYRGGYFINCFIGRIWRDYGVHLPRPLVLRPGTAGSPPVYQQIFPAHTIRAGPYPRTRFSSLDDTIRNALRDITTLSTVAGTPEAAGNTELLATQAIGALQVSSDIPIGVTAVVPANPGSGSLVVSGSAHPPPPSSIMTALAYYRTLPLSAPNASRNVAFEIMMNDIMSGGATTAQATVFEKRLQRRIKAVTNAKSIARELRLVWPREHHYPTGSQLKQWRVAERFIVWEKGHAWTDVRDLFVNALVESTNGMGEAEVGFMTKMVGLRMIYLGLKFRS